jgi:hypothetical protein
MERGGMQGERGMDRQGMQLDQSGGAGTGRGFDMTIDAVSFLIGAGSTLCRYGA